MTALVDVFTQQPEPARPRILMVLEARYPPPRGGGGAEHQVDKLAKYFAGQGYPVEVWVPAGENAANPATPAHAHVTVRHIPHPRVRWLGGLVLQLNLARMLLKHRHDYAAVHAHIAGALALTCCLVGPWLHRPVVVKFTGFADVERREGQSRASQYLRRRLLSRATFIQAISRRIHAGLRRAGLPEGAVQHVPNGVDLARHLPEDGLRRAVREELQLPEDAVVAVFSGRIEQVKGIDDLLDAWELACANRPECHLVVIGSLWQEVRDAIDRRCEGRSTLARIHFLNRRTDVIRLLHAADFAVLPSHAEGLSNALLEFMATGLPVVGTRVSGTEDLVHDGAEGFVCEPQDVRGLANALRRMLAMPAEDRHAMGERARATVARECSIESVAGRLLALYGMPPRDNWTGEAVPCAE